MSKYARRSHNKKPLTRFLPSFRLSRKVMIVCIVLFGAAFVVLGNLGTAKAYQTRDLEAKLADLRRENRRLELEVVKASAAEAIAAEVQTLGLIPASHVAYIEAGTTEVAQR